MKPKIKAENFDLDEYLNRIGYTGKVSNDGENATRDCNGTNQIRPF